MPFSNLLRCDDSLALIVDLQERLLPAIQDAAELLRATHLVLTAASTLSVPTLLTEQNPAGLGGTSPAILAAAPNAQILEKMHFSAAREDSFVAAIRATGRRQIVVCGTEAHVCVLQTVLGLLRLNLDVFVVVDAVGSRARADRLAALERMRDQGARLVTAEMVVYEWLERCATEAFRALLPTIRDWRQA